MKIELKYCRVCDDHYHPSSFYRPTTSICIPCTRGMRRERYRRNVEKEKANAYRWLEKNKIKNKEVVRKSRKKASLQLADSYVRMIARDRGYTREQTYKNPGILKQIRKDLIQKRKKWQRLVLQ
jgi:hypothetical protein